MSYYIEIYRLDVVLEQFIRIDIIDRGYKNLSFFNTLNGVGAARFELPIQHPKATEVNLRRFINQIAIWRNGVIQFFGPITSVDAKYTNVTGTITVDCNSYGYHLKSKFSNQLDIYKNIDLSDIAWDQIDIVQNRTNGTLLINQGVLQTSISDSINIEYKSILDTLTELTSYVDGFDYTLTPIIGAGNLVTEVKFDTFSTRLGYLRTDLPPLQIGINVEQVELKTAPDIQNSGIALGSGTGTSILISTLDYSSSQQAYTRREVINSFKSQSVSSVLSYLNQAYLNNSSVETYICSISTYEGVHPTIGDYSIGDELLIDIQVAGGNYINLSGSCRVIEIDVNVLDTGAEQIIPKVILLN